MAVIHNTQQQLAIGITSGLLLFTTLIVGIRLYIRCILLKAGSAGWDDLTVSIAWVMAVGASIATYFEINSGLGRHLAELTKEQIHSFELSLFILIQFYSVGVNVVKISFLIQFYRIFPDQRVRKICVYFAFFSFLWMIGQNILYALSCRPTTDLVNNPHLKEICVPTLSVWTAISCINVGTDLIIFSIPLKPLWNMHLLQRQRYLLIGIFCFGFIVVIISIVRISTLRQGASSPDPTFTNVHTALWSLAELETAILCTSLPILRPIVARFMRGVAPPDVADGHLKGPHGQFMNVQRVRRGPRRLPGESLLIPTVVTGSTEQSPKYKTSTIGEQEISPPPLSPPPLPCLNVNDWLPRAPEPEERPVPDSLGSKTPASVTDVVTWSSVGPLRSPTYEEMLPPHFLDNGTPRPMAKTITRGTQMTTTWEPLVDPFQAPEAIEEPNLEEIDLEANKAGARVTQERAEEISEAKERISPLLADAHDRNRENIDALSLASRLTRGIRRGVGMSWLRLSSDSGFNSSRYWKR